MPQTIDNMSVTWTNSLTTYTGIKLNAAGSSDANSAAGSLLMDLQVGGSSRFSVGKAGQVNVPNLQGYFCNGTNYGIQFSTGDGETYLRANGVSAITLSSSSMRLFSDVFLTRRAAANLRLGAADTTGTTAPTAQTLSVQSWTSSTNNNQQGANFTIAGSQGTGTGAGGSIIFQVAPAGAVSNGVQNALATALTIDSAGVVDITRSTVAGGITFGQYGRLDAFGWTMSNTGGFIGLAGTNGSADVILRRDAANTLALRNGANAQTFRVYNTTDGTNSELMAIAWTGNTCYIEAGKTGTGNARPLWVGTGGSADFSLYTNGNARWYITGSTGHFLAQADNTYDIGAFGNAPRNIIVRSNIHLGAGGTTSALLRASGNGILRIGNYNDDNFDRLQFGGTTSSFPSLKRVSANIQVIAADNSGSAGFIVGNQALATNATDGFLYVPTCAGTPTGTPTAQTGTVPIVVDTTNNKLYFYSNAAWRDAGP